MALDLNNLSPEVNTFLTERHLASLTLLRLDGSPHVTPIGFTWDPEQHLARIITWKTSVKSKILLMSGGGMASICQIDGGRWLTLEGRAIVSDDPMRCLEGTNRYAERYREPKDRSDRTVIEVTVSKILGRA